MRGRLRPAWALVVLFFRRGETADALQRPEYARALHDHLVAPGEPVDQPGVPDASERLDRHGLVSKAVGLTGMLLTIDVRAALGVEQRRSRHQNAGSG